MSLRPIAARWFELVTLRKDLGRAVACLAHTNAVELETGEPKKGEHQRADRVLVPLAGSADALRTWHELANRYGAYWPPAEAVSPPEETSTALAAAITELADWKMVALPLIDEIERSDVRARELKLLADWLASIGDAPLPLDLLGRAGPRLAARLIAYPATVPPPTELPQLLVSRIATTAATYLLLLGRASDIAAIEAAAVAAGALTAPIADWLPAEPKEAREEVARRREALVVEQDDLKARLAHLAGDRHMAETLGTLRIIEWLSAESDKLRASERLVWVTGWTTDETGEILRKALEKEGVHALVRVTQGPEDRQPPVLMHNPLWARGFEAFVRMLGTPARGEADPSLILAVIAPLLFGFMFGDIGHGLVLLAVGLAFKDRFPQLAILIPGGLFAVLFGFMFGSVFAREDLLQPLWLRPLDEPVELLVAALAIGAGILAIGLLLDAVQAHWRGEVRLWWGARAGLVLAYAGLVAAPLQLASLWLIPLGAAWFVIGAARSREERLFIGMATAAAEFIEQFLQLAINTVSFARVGAFALAHAGLSAAVVGVADAAGTVGYWVVLFLGNILIIALEGLVVAIQTTRLILFEFFIRFLKGGGRPFNPLAPPDGPSRSDGMGKATIHNARS